MGNLLAWLASIQRKASPAYEFLLRLYLAKSVFTTGLMGVMSASMAAQGQAHHLLYSWVPASAMVVALSWVDLLLAASLATGLAARVAALVRLSMIVFGHPDFSSSPDLLATGLLAWVVLQSAGAWSLDRLLSHGLSSTAIPLAQQTIDELSKLTTRTRPLFILLFRLWVTYLVVGSILGASSADQLALPHWARWLAAISFSVGLFCSPIALCLAVMELGVHVMSSAPLGTMYWPITVGLLAVVGPGFLSADQLLRFLCREPELDPSLFPHVVVIGAGFGGLACVHRLRSRPVRVTLIDKRNFHLFQPLLYQVATASLSPGDIATPVRAVLRDIDNVSVLYQKVIGIDPVAKLVLTDQGSTAYDFLVIATGASHGYFGHQDWAQFAPGLKTLEDAISIRRQVLTAFERAEHTSDPKQRAALLTFVICGGGPTGVELAGALAELSHHGLAGELKNFEPSSANIVVVQSGERLLPAFHKRLSAAALSSLESLGVTVLLNTRVTSVDEFGVTIGTKRLDAGLVLWAAGVVASPAAHWLGQEPDSAGRIKVGPDLAVPDCPGVFAIGDTAFVAAWRGQPVPGLAQAAKQGGQYVAGRILQMIGSTAAPTPFMYRHRGSLATIGRKTAVAEFGRVRLDGAAAWWLWGALHVAFLVGARNRLTVMLGWLWSYFTYAVGVQLITGEIERPEPVSASSSNSAFSSP
jgi:putative oxidoreductase